MSIGKCWMMLPVVTDWKPRSAGWQEILLKGFNSSDSKLSITYIDNGTDKFIHKHFKTLLHFHDYGKSEQSPELDCNYH